ncbi:MAG: hypothetical protein NVSMB46_04060 [Candidatus Saccharimonadales bacterium]
MTIQELFITSNQALLQSIEHITGSKWDIVMPPRISHQPASLKEAVRYHTYDDAWVPDILSGKTKDEVGDVYEPLLTSNHVLDNYRFYNQTAIDAVVQFDDLERITHLSYGDYPARDYLQHIISFRAFRSYDIGTLIGIDTTMSPDFVTALIEEFRPVAELYRHMGSLALQLVYQTKPVRKQSY